MTSVTLDLPRPIYQKAVQIARATKRPIEQVVVEWIQPPAEHVGSVQEAALIGLESMSTEQLTQVARSTSVPDDRKRLQELLSLQEQRPLTAAERTEAGQLVEQEDLLTLRKAKALFLLKQRNALPANIAMLLS